MDESSLKNKVSFVKQEVEIEGQKDLSNIIIANLSQQTHINDINYSNSGSQQAFSRNRNRKQSQFGSPKRYYGSLSKQNPLEKLNVNKINLNAKNGYQKKLFQALKIKQFTSKLIQKIKFSRFSNRDQYNLFADKTSFYWGQNDLNQKLLTQKQSFSQKNYQNLKLFYRNCKYSLGDSNLFQILLSLISRIPVIRPTCNFKVIWDIIIIVVILLYFFMIPIEFTFFKSMQQLFPYKLLLFCNSVLILDLILQWNFGCFDKGQPNMNRIQVMIRYFKSQFYLDFLSSLFILLHFFWQYNSTSYLHLLFFLRYKEIKRFFKRIEERFNLSPLIIQVSSLLQLLLLIVIVAHIIGCVWIQVAQYEIQNNFQSIWINDKKINTEEWVSYYIQAYYFSTVTMITVGYGDIKPSNPTEMVVSVFTMLFSCGVFAYSINAIGTIFNTLNQKSLDKKNNMYIISSYMAKKNIDFELQMQIKQYLEYYWDIQYSRDKEQEQNLINQLSPKLKERLLFQTFKMFILDNKIFKDNFSQQFVIDVIQLIQECSYRPDEIIVSETIQDDNSLYFIDSGEVQVFMDEDAKKILKCLKKGDYFGDYSFFTGQSTNLNFKATEFTQVLKIKRSNIFDLFKNRPSDHEAFCNIKDNLLYIQNYSIINSKCYYCLKSHLTMNCPKIFPKFNKIRIANISNQSVQQTRNSGSKERYLQKQPEFLYLNSIQMVQQQFAIDFQHDIDDYLQKFASKEDDDHELQEQEDFDQVSQSICYLNSQQDLSFDSEAKRALFINKSLSQQSIKKNKISFSNLEEESLYQKTSTSKAKSKTNFCDEYQQLNPQSTNNNNSLIVADQSIYNQRNQKKKPKSNLQIQPTLKIQCLISPRPDKISDLQQLENHTSNNMINYENFNKQNTLNNIQSTKHNSQDFKNSKERSNQPSLISEFGNSGIIHRLQQIFDKQNSFKKQKLQNLENEEYDVQKNFEIYLPHNNLSYIIEYMKFKSRFFKQLKYQHKLNQNAKNQQDQQADQINKSNSNLKESNYMNQYPFNTPNCQRNFQIMRVFQKKSLYKFLNKDQKNNENLQIQQIILNNQNIKNSLPNTKLQKFLEKCQFASQNQTEAASQDTLIHPMLRNMNQINKSNTKNEGESYQVTKKNSFLNENNQMFSSQKNSGQFFDSSQINLYLKEENGAVPQSIRNYFERKDLLSSRRESQIITIKDQQQKQITRKEIIQQISQDQDEIESLYSQKKIKINSSKRIQKDQYFQSDSNEEENISQTNSYKSNRMTDELSPQKNQTEQKNKKILRIQQTKKQKKYKIEQVIF